MGKSDDSEMQDAATRLLGEWLTVDAGPVLLELAKDGQLKMTVINEAVGKLDSNWLVCFEISLKSAASTFAFERNKATNQRKLTALHSSAANRAP